MKSIFTLLLAFAGYVSTRSQEPLRDESIIYQQERMVFKDWDRDKFTPKPGFLGLNPLYWLTWGLHPDYPKNDLRPLAVFGPQTRRLSLALAMQHTENSYKLHSDTLMATASEEAAAHSGLLAQTDPLWLLYYSRQFSSLLEENQQNPMSGLGLSAQRYLQDSGIYDWYIQESALIRQRLETARATDMERGSRIITWHRMLGEYRKLISVWESARGRSARNLLIKDAVKSIREGTPLNGKAKTDIQIADEILKHSKL